MPQAMTKVQEIAAASVELVFLDVLKFNSQHISDRLQEGCLVPLFDFVDVLDKDRCPRLATHHVQLDNLAEPTVKVFRFQRRQKSGIDINFSRRIKRAD